MAIITKEILKGINNKELKAWEKLYSAYYSALCSYANSILKNADSSQDVVQETLIKIWYSDRIFPDSKDLTWYLYRSVYNNTLFHLRTQNIHQQILERLPVDEVEMPDDQFARTVQEELIRQIYVYIEELPEERRKIILLNLK